ncbi:MAG: class I SAM-dependent methyltransferase, partial [Blastocatellia bacterium]
MSGEDRPGLCFDAYASNYDDAINSGLSVSGENREYFARMRVEWLARSLKRLGEKPATAIDFGCGVGSAAPFLLDCLGLESYWGIDTSAESIVVARESSSDARACFYEFHDFKSDGTADLVFCNGVFHHIPVSERPGAVDYILSSLKPGGLFAFWDNNPWNPGTQYVMSRIPFDRDA